MPSWPPFEEEEGFAPLVLVALVESREVGEFRAGSVQSLLRSELRGS